MMIATDSTIWVDFLTGVQSEPVAELERLANSGELLNVPGVSILEILSGINDERHVARVQDFFRLGPSLEVEAPDDYIVAARLQRLMEELGLRTRSENTCLVAAVCIRGNAPLLHADPDFDEIAAHTDLKIWQPSA